MEVKKRKETLLKRIADDGYKMISNMIILLYYISYYISYIICSISWTFLAIFATIKFIPFVVYAFLSLIPYTPTIEGNVYKKNYILTMIFITSIAYYRSYGRFNGPRRKEFLISFMFSAVTFTLISLLEVLLVLPTRVIYFICSFAIYFTIGFNLLPKVYGNRHNFDIRVQKAMSDFKRTALLGELSGATNYLGN